MELFKKNIEQTTSTINNLFKNQEIDNCVITLDFTFFFPEQNSNDKWNVHIFQYAPQEYTDLLKCLYIDAGDKFAKFDDKTKVVRDLNDQPSKINKIIFQNPQEYNNQVLNTKNFTPKDWHNDLISKNFGGASIVVSKEFNKDNYHIQAGVYLILAKKIGCFQLDTFETGDNSIEKIEDTINKDIVKNIWAYLENLLFDEMFELVINKFKNIESEKEQIERERNFHVGMAHYIKNSMTGLARQEGEIIKFISKQSNAEKIKLVAKTQRLIYYLINLVLQLRQKKDVLEIGKIDIPNDSVSLVSLPIINLIQTAYIHTVLSKNKLQKFIDTWEEEDRHKAEEAIDAIEKNLNAIKNSFDKQDNTNIFKPWDKNFIFETLKSDNGHSFIEIINESSEDIEMTINQCKSIYAAFLEIFDNIFGDKHGMHNASIYIKSGSIKIIAYNTQRKQINWQDDFNDLTSDINTDGLGLKIIQSAIKECGWGIQFTEGKAKEEKIDDRTIKTYCYKISTNI